MNLSKEDPRLTAYALGEIESTEECAAIEAAVNQSEELQVAVADIRATADLLESSLQSAPAPAMSEWETEQLCQPPTASLTERFLGDLRHQWPLVAGLAAACAVAAVVWLPKMQSPMENSLHSEDSTVLEDEASKPNIDLSMKAVANLETRKQQQVERVDEAKLSISEFRAQQNLPISQPDSSITLPREPPQEARISVKNSHSTSVAAVEVNLPQMEESFTVSSGLGGFGGEGKLGAQRGRLSIGKGSVNVFGLKSMTDEECLARQDADRGFNAESYDPIEESDFRSPLVAPLSTFSIDVDTASYANVRRFLNLGKLPPPDAVRIEELINYFSYNDAAPSRSLDEGGDPFAVHMSQTVAPWNHEHHLLRIALKGYEMPWSERPASNLVFLLDVSGSMSAPNKLPLVKEAMDILIQRLDARDRVAIIVYAGASGLVLPSTTANNRETIAHALNNLKAGGSTNAGAGIELAYSVAREHLIEDGNNRVILCTDGDFNVGQTNRGELSNAAESAADAGVSLTVLGFGMHNYKDDMLESLSNKGKGSYAYIDSRQEARKVFLQDVAGNLFKIAKDVKIQVEFNPAHVSAYRLIGYENRRLQAEDFNNDAKKAGDIGPGHSVVALYELVPIGADLTPSEVDPLRYQKAAPGIKAPEGEVATVKLRYKRPDGDTSRLITKRVLSDTIVPLEASSEDVRFTTAVAAFGLKLSDSEHLGDYSFSQIEKLATNALSESKDTHRHEFTELVRKADRIAEANQ